MLGSPKTFAIRNKFGRLYPPRAEDETTQGFCPVNAGASAVIRGAIEGVSHNRVHGWIWSDDVALAGRTVLAFLDDGCIGAGKVDGFRQDLKDAGLGDGLAGFGFDVNPVSPLDALRVTVRLEGSDAMLVQSRARIGFAPLATPAKAQRQKPGLDTLEWMRARGWLSQAEFDFIRGLRDAGVRARSLLAPGAEAQSLDPAETARGLLQLDRMSDAAIRRETLATPRDWRRLAESEEAAAGPGAPIALLSAVHAALPILEGSHLRPPLPDADLPAGVEHALGPDRLLFLDARCLLGPGASFPPDGVEAFFLAT
jgi:hypothetical protein